MFIDSNLRISLFRKKILVKTVNGVRTINWLSKGRKEDYIIRHFTASRRRHATFTVHLPSIKHSFDGPLHF